MTTRKLIDDCFVHDKDRLRHAEALALLKARVAPVTAAEMLPLAAAAGRILALAVAAKRPVPAHHNAAVDGYAFAKADHDKATDGALPVSGRAAAGHPLTTAAATGTAVRIFTGAVLPEGCDTVVMQEDVGVAGGLVKIPQGLKSGANVRKAGEDVRQGETLFRPGHIVRPQDLAALASVGLAEVSCFQRLSVAIVSTGDEVIRPGTRALEAGDVFDANAPMLGALVASAGADFTDLGVLPDDPAAIRSALAAAAGKHHVILTSGGASRGEEDHMVAVLDALGKRHLWQLAVKPGRPMSFGQIGDCVVVGLPGNPVAVFVCVLMYVWPMLRSLAGAPWPEPRRLMLPAAFNFPDRKTGRREYWRGMLRDGPADNPCGLTVDKYTRDGSGLISSLRESDCLIEIPEDVTGVAVGDPVAVIPFTEFGIV